MNIIYKKEKILLYKKINQIFGLNIICFVVYEQ